MNHKFAVGDRIRLTQDVSDTLPFLQKGAVGAIQECCDWQRDERPVYFLTMDPAGSFVDPTTLDYWFTTEDLLEAE